ncbi:unnamed protein product, partial [Rotaria sp. Silwood1]
LNRLREKKFILQWQYKRMIPDVTKCELAHLYFNPKTHKDGIPVRPIENTILAPTTNISNFLDEIIRPIFDNKCSTTSIIDGVSLIKDLNRYTKRGLLKSTTLFCTFDIRNLYTMLPQEEALNILIEFLHVHGYNKVKCIPLEAIRKLASIVLKENVFVYDKKIYRQVLGGAMGSSFTLTLANIFMWKWQKEFVRRQDMTGEFYGRYIDDIFMTWNKSEKALQDILDEANTWHPNIKLEYKISQSLPFLDVLLTNNHGILSTSVYHKPSAEPSVVPFISDHPPHTFINIIKTGLTRAVRYSSTFEIFNNERLYVKLTLLYNRQVLGGAMGSSFTLTLANIFMWKWQKEFVRRQDMTGEFYGRYIDDIFMTWNKSEKALQDILDEANTWHPNIKLEYKISRSLPFLDVFLTNNHGILSTSVYHKPSAEPSVVPFISDHPSHTFANIIKTGLTRAVRYSSTFEIFNNERLYVKLTLLYNGYPSSLIETQFRRFFSEYISSSSFLPYMDDEKQFLILRNTLLKQPTHRQSQVSMSATKADIHNDQADGVHTVFEKTADEKGKQKHDFPDKLIVHYTHEKRFQSTKRDIHRVYDDVFRNTPKADVKLIVGNKNRRDAKNELIRKRPKQSTLRNKPMKSMSIQKMQKTINYPSIMCIHFSF